MSIIPIIIATQAAAHAALENKVLDRLREAGATDSASAAPYPGDDPVERGALDRLVREGMVREAAPGRFWVDEAALAARDASRFRAGTGLLVVLGAIVLLGLLAFLLLRRG